MYEYPNIRKEMAETIERAKRKRSGAFGEFIEKCIKSQQCAEEGLEVRDPQ